MFRTRPLFVAVAMAFAFVPGTARAADEPKDILAKAIKAHGGEELLTKQKAGQIKTKGKITIPGVGETEYSQEASYMLPDKFKDVMELKIGGKNIGILTIVNGDKVTLEVDGNAVDAGDTVKKAMKDIGHVMEVSRMVPLKNKVYELSIIGEDKVEGKKVIGVRVSRKDHKDVSLYFDKETHLIAKVEFRTIDQATSNEVTEERLPSNYEKDKDGVPVAKKIVVKRDGKVFLEAEIVEEKHFEKLDESEFKK